VLVWKANRKHSGKQSLSGKEGSLYDFKFSEQGARNGFLESGIRIGGRLGGVAFALRAGTLM